jgi:beta-lactam-binding protein with PASTA domain
MELDEQKEAEKEFDVKKMLNKPKPFLLICVGVVLFVLIIAVTVFFLSVRGAEQTMVPDLRDKQLVDALLELQQKELYPRIQLRYSGSAEDKGKILEQDPRPGAIVKAGRRIRLVISQGVMVSAVDNYINQNIDDVRRDLQTLFANNPQPLITLKEPFLYQFSTKGAGTILEQSPAPGTGIFSTVALEFVISKGPRRDYTPMPSLVGLKIGDAMELIAQSGIRWTIEVQEDSKQQNAETVIAQDPPPSSALPTDLSATITVAAPSKISEKEVAGLFKYDLPENPYPLLTKLEFIPPGGERRLIAAVNHAGGGFTYPYRVPKGSVLVLTLLDRELYRVELDADNDD